MTASTGWLRSQPTRRPQPRRVKWRGRSGHAFVAAYVLLLVVFGVVPSAYFAFQNNDVNTAAAVSVELLLIGLVVAALFVARSGSFDAD